MRNQFKEGELPAETPTRSAGSDISSFSQIHQGLLDIDSKCSSENNEPGWYPLGKHPLSVQLHLPGKSCLKLTIGLF